MKEIQLTQGKVALVDDADFEELSQYKWTASFQGWNWYAKRGTRRGGKQATIFMHRVIIACPDGFQVDHRDGDGLNNVRDNLRIVTNQQNSMNAKGQRRNPSGFKGVSWFAPRRIWRARIEFNGKAKTLGYFATPEEAAVVYDDAARKLFGKFARLNLEMDGDE